MGVGKQFIVWILACLPLVAFAGESLNLYEIEILTIAGAPTRERTDVARDALEQALVRLTGSKAILKNAAITSALKYPDKYVNQFSYHQRSTGEHFTKVSFNEKSLNQLVYSAEQSVWSNTRPVSLVWLMLMGEKPQWVVGEHLENSLKNPLAESLNRRGIPYVFPLFDLNDVSEISEQDFITQNELPFLTAAKRYETELVLLGKCKQEGSDWEIEWTLLQSGQKSNWQNKGSDLKVLLEESAEALGKRLARTTFFEKKGESRETIGETGSVVSETSKGMVQLNMLGINSAEQYSKVLESLRDLPFVMGVDVVQVTPEKTVFSLKTTASHEKIVHAMESVPLWVHTKMLGDNETNSLTYRLVGVH